MSSITKEMFHRTSIYIFSENIDLTSDIDQTSFFVSTKIILWVWFHFWVFTKIYSVTYNYLCHFWTKLLLTYRNQHIKLCSPPPVTKRKVVKNTARTTLDGNRKTKWKTDWSYFLFKITYNKKHRRRNRGGGWNIYCQTAFAQKQCICLLLCICMCMLLL